MRMYKEYPYDGWQNHVAELKNFLEEKNFKYLDGSLEEKNFIIVMDHEDINKYVPNLINFFKNNNLSTSCIMMHGSCNTSDPPLNLHIDKIPLMEKFYYSPYAINLPIQNVEGTYLAYYEIIDPSFELEEDKPFTENEVKEITRINYNEPLVVRIDKLHAVCNVSDKCRITASMRFTESLEEYFTHA